MFGGTLAPAAGVCADTSPCRVLARAAAGLLPDVEAVLRQDRAGAGRRLAEHARHRHRGLGARHREADRDVRLDAGAAGRDLGQHGADRLVARRRTCTVYVRLAAVSFWMAGVELLVRAPWAPARSGCSARR